MGFGSGKHALDGGHRPSHEVLDEAHGDARRGAARDERATIRRVERTPGFERHPRPHPVERPPRCEGDERKRLVGFLEREQPNDVAMNAVSVQFRSLWARQAPWKGLTGCRFLQQGWSREPLAADARRPAPEERARFADRPLRSRVPVLPRVAQRAVRDRPARPRRDPHAARGALRGRRAARALHGRRAAALAARRRGGACGGDPRRRRHRAHDERHAPGAPRPGTARSRPEAAHALARFARPHPLRAHHTRRPPGPSARGPCRRARRRLRRDQAQHRGAPGRKRRRARAPAIFCLEARPHAAFHRGDADCRGRGHRERAPRAGSRGARALRPVPRGGVARA